MEGMTSPPGAHGNASSGAVHGQLLQVRDIHGGVTLQAPAPAPPPPADVSLDPPRPATAVRGREGLLEALGGAMTAGAPVPHVLTGPGGFGKTTVAAALAERARRDGWTVFWVRPGSVAASMVEAAVEVGGSRQEAEQVKGARRQAARWVWRHLDAAARPWLLVIDNADRPEELDPENRPGDQLGWMRASPGGFVLVTSRVDDPAQWAPARVHRIGELEGSAASEALADHAGAGGAAELAGAEELARRLGGVPLALSLAGRILATHRVLFPDAHALLARLGEGVGALDELAAPLVTGGDVERRLLSGVWELSLRLVEEREPKAVPLLKLLSIFCGEGRELPLRRLPVSRMSGDPLGFLDEAELARAVNSLVVQGLVTVVTAHGETALRLHPLVSETVRAGFTTSDLALLEQAEELLTWQQDHDPLVELTAYTNLLGLRTQLRAVDLPTFNANAGSFVRLLMENSTQINRKLIHLGLTEWAYEQAMQLWSIAEENYGPTHQLTLRARHHLAEAQMNQGLVEEAEIEYRALFELNGLHHGPDHENTLDARFQLALIAIRREEWGTAMEEFRAVLDAWRRVSGPEDARALAAWENLAYAVMREGDPVSAGQEFREVRLIRARTMGERHPLTAQADYYLGRAAFENGDLNAAQSWFEACLKVREQALGKDHPDTERAREWRDRAARGEQPDH
ncbi:tetratricopeptide repeat protein [Nocardiopsis alborubida]|uniref:Tetratricopeptide repeat protein n=2 Tax=Nocardiopsis alborubida TaxID=146802 RepID=A0A7X6RPE6_9ACTN|nr:tetratricopeptide repeat protein [Nocardiopsis alborubida]NKY97508.1 tetratricopeptide repeat protein [Nocardiopsis alborubida]